MIHKCSFEEALQIAEKKDAKGKGERERYTCLNAEFPRIVGRDRKAFLSKQCKEIEGKKTEWEKLVEISSRKLEIPMNISCRDGHNKGQKQQGTNRSRRDEEKVTRIHRTVQKRP